MRYTAEQLIKRFDSLDAERGTWKDHWEDIARYVMPRRGDYMTKRTPGEKKNFHLLDNTALVSAELLAGALHGLMTNPNARWFELTTGNPELDSNEEIRSWLQDTTITMHSMLNNSNFQTEVHEFYLDLVSIATAAMSVEEDDTVDVYFASRHLSEVVISENAYGWVREVYRAFEMSAAQIKQKWPKVAAKAVNEALEKDPDRKFMIIHGVYEEMWLKTDKAKPAKPYASQYVLKIDKEMLEEGGFDTFPVIVSRWAKAAGEKYGRGPGMVALPEAKMVNKMAETTIIGAQKAVDPPLQAPDDGFNKDVITRPGGISYYRAGSPDRIEPIYNDTRIDFGFEALRERRTRIREAFYIDQLQLGQGPQMTATEVVQRTEEKSRLLAPLLGRQQAEFLRPLIDRVFSIGMKKGRFKPIPEILTKAMGGRDLPVIYSSPIAQSQRLAEGQSILRTIEAATPFVQMDQGVMDLINGDEAFKVLASIHNFPQKAMRKEREVKQMREARAQAQQQMLEQQQQQQQVDQAAKLAPAVQAEANMERTQ
jgi:hypothetical protein